MTFGTMHYLIGGVVGLLLVASIAGWTLSRSVRSKNAP